VEHADELLRSHIGDADTVKVVVPVVRQGFLTGSRMTRRRSAARSGSRHERPRSSRARPRKALAGEANVGLAVRDALATFAADEIVVVVRPGERLIESVATDSASDGPDDADPLLVCVDDAFAPGDRPGSRRRTGRLRGSPKSAMVSDAA
jgi:hypothetical protein